MTVNKAAKLKLYPLPRIEDLLVFLAEGKTFTKLDLSHDYLQVKLDEESKKYVTVNTHTGDTQEPLPVPETAVWSPISSSNFSAAHGEPFAWFTWCVHLPG